MARADSYEIDSASSAITVFTPNPGRRFVCLYLALQAEANGSVQVQSASTDVSGPVNLTSGEIYQFQAAPYPVFIGRAAGEALRIANPGTVQINGTALVYEWEVRT